MNISRVSGQGTHFTLSQSTTFETESISFQPGGYVGCLYVGFWWIGSIRSISDEEDDLEIVFMHPHGPVQSFKWPQREDVCWVAKEHILCSIQAPTTNTGRSYTIVAADRATIENKYVIVKN
ncbi:MAG: hypothetical protein WAX04_08140 [Oscillospiraceae bacterium]